MWRFLWLLLVGLVATSPLSAQELKLRYALTSHGEEVAFSADGKSLVSTSNSGEITLWDTTTGKNIASLSGHTDEAVSVVFSPDGKMLASASEINPLFCGRTKMIHSPRENPDRSFQPA